MLTPPAALHAILFASTGPVSKKHLSSHLGCKESELRAVLDALAASLKNSGLTLVETPTEVELRTAAEAATVIKKLRESELSRDLGRAGLETLAAVAYQEGATRTDIDWVRGVNSSASLRTLLLRGLIEGREDPHDKRRVQYHLTTEALAYLGVARTEDLPRHAELKASSARVIREETARTAAADAMGADNESAT